LDRWVICRQAVRRVRIGDFEDDYSKRCRWVRYEAEDHDLTASHLFTPVDAVVLHCLSLGRGHVLDK
jgi:hypothetical protein